MTKPREKTRAELQAELEDGKKKMCIRDRYMRADTRLPPYLPYPRFLLQADLTQTAKLLYALLLDRATLSQANGWLDEGGRIYLVFPIERCV